MRERDTAVFGFYKDMAEAENAVDRMVESRTVAGGFTHNDISVLLPDAGSTKEFAEAKSTHEPEETSAGVAVGRAVGAAVGLLAGIVATAIPRLGRFLAAGPIAGALADSESGSAVGGLVGALTAMGVPEYEAKRYAARLGEGGVLLSVHRDTTDEITRAESLLKSTGAADVSFACKEPAGQNSRS
jgi:hypothetical protein